MLTPHQLEMRSKGIGGSDAAAVCGISKYKTPFQVWNRLANGIVEEEEMSHAMYWGLIHEPAITKEFMAQTHIQIIKPEETFIHSEYEFIIGNIDGWNPNEKVLLECKTSRFDSEWGEPGTCEIPDEYLCQVAHYAMILDAKIVYIAVLIAGNDFRIYKYTRNPKLEKTLLEKEKYFWYEHVTKQSPPCASNSTEANKIWLQSYEDSVCVTDDLFFQLDKLKSIKSQINSLSQEKDRIETDIKNHMKFSEKLIAQTGEILASWKTQTANRFDTTRFKKEHTALYEQYIKPSQSRVFRINGGLNHE